MTLNGNREHSAQGAAAVRRMRQAKRILEPARIERIIQFLSVARSFDEFYIPPNFGFHPLTGDRAGSYAITVTRNWRLTFKKVDEQAVADLDLEDYH